MITLAIDTCESRGSVAVLRDGLVLAHKKHADGTDYSAWLLPAVDEVLSQAGVKMEHTTLLAVATGPGSFTGLRVGLTTVKAWSEVYGMPVVGVSRLEALAHSGGATTAGYAAVCYNAQRGQLFAGLYALVPNPLRLLGDERVVSAQEFVEYVDQRVGETSTVWISPDPAMINDLELFQRRASDGDTLQVGPPELASTIGALAEERASRGEFSDPLALDANYVRRSDAEIFWKGPAVNVR